MTNLTPPPKKRKALAQAAPDHLKKGSELPDIETLLNRREEDKGGFQKWLNRIRARIHAWKMAAVENRDKGHVPEIMTAAEFDSLMGRANRNKNHEKIRSYMGDITDSSAYSVLQAFFMEIHGKTDISAWADAKKPDFEIQHKPFAQAYSTAQTAFLRICEPFSYCRMNIVSSPLMIDNLIALRLREFRFPDLAELGCTGDMEMEADCIAFADNSFLIRFFLPQSHSQALYRRLRSDYGAMASFILEHHRQQSRMLDYYRGEGKEKDEQMMSEQGMSMLKITNLSYWSAYHMLLAGLENGVLMGVLDGADMNNHINHYEIIGLHRPSAKKKKAVAAPEYADWASKGASFDEFEPLYQFFRKNSMLNPRMRLGKK